MLHIVLVEPEIPQNTGNIVRTAAATGSRVHLVRPLGFEVSDKHLKRAGLDYWHLTVIRYYDGIEEVLSAYPGAAFYFASTKARLLYTDADYTFSGGGAESLADAAAGRDVFVVFGRESKGLPEPLLRAHYDRCIRIPMVGGARSLNLSNAVAVVVYEAMRQNAFAGLQGAGTLTKKEG